MLKLHVPLLALLFITGCATTQLPANLAGAILNSDDLQTVEDGLPSYLLLVDALTQTYPKSENMHLTAAALNGAYAGVFVPDEQIERKKRMSAKAFGHALTAFCLHDKDACGLQMLPPNEFVTVVEQWDRKKDLPYLYALGTGWASYIQANSDDWLVVAELGRAETVLTQLVSIDPAYERGMAQLYLGVMNSILPPSLGGKPEVAKAYYEGALAAGKDENLIIYVYYAANFARLIFDKQLHDDLLQQALLLDPYVEGLTLQNLYAQKLAQDLLASSDDYF